MSRPGILCEFGLKQALPIALMPGHKLARAPSRYERTRGLPRYRNIRDATEDHFDLIHHVRAKRALALRPEKQAFAWRTVGQQYLVPVQKKMHIGHLPGCVIRSDPVHPDKVLGGNQHLIGIEHAPRDP